MDINEIISREIWSMDEDNLEEDYPASFNMEQFKALTSFAARKRYADEHLQKIASGSGRHVYVIDNDMVLKLAANKKGLAQNQEEHSISSMNWNENEITKVIDSHPNNLWIESERAKKVTPNRFKELSGYRVEDVGTFLQKYDHNANGRGQYYGGQLNKELEADMWENEFTTGLGDMIGNFAQSAGDLGRISSYGEVNRDGNPQIVLIDYGLSHDVLDTYYRRQREGVEGEDENNLNEVTFQMQDHLDNAAEDGHIKDGGYASAASMPQSVSEAYYDDYRNISTQDLKSTTDWIEKFIPPTKLVKNEISTIFKNYLIGSQNIKTSMEITNNDLNFYNKLMDIQKYLKNFGMLKEDLVYWGADDASPDSNEYKLGAEGINEDGASLYTNTQGTVDSDDVSWELQEMILDSVSNIISERILSWMPKAKEVTVKKECQLGGNGDGTSKACNQGDMNALELKDIQDENSSKPNEPNVAEDNLKDRHYFKNIDRMIKEEILNLDESVIKRNEKDEIFDYSSVKTDTWNEPIKQGKEFYKVNFDLENNDSTKEKKTLFFKKNLRKDQPIKYEINAELWKAGGDWEYPVMYFKIEITHHYGLKLNDEEKKALKEPKFPWDLENESWTNKFVMIPPVEAGNKLTKYSDLAKDKYNWAAWQDESISDAGLKDKDITITDGDHKSAWKWLEELLEDAVDDRHKMLDESVKKKLKL